MTVSRAYRNASDLRMMQELLIGDFAHAETRVGDLPWRARSHTHYERTLEITLWCDGERPIGWTWLRDNGGCDVYIVSTHRASSQLWGEMLAQLEGLARSRRRAGDAIDELHLWFAADLPIVEALLSAHGFTRSDEPGGQILIHDDLSRIPEPPLPPGCTFGWVDDESVVPRVELHRAAFAPSELTVTAYGRGRTTWPDRPELDRVVRTSSGKVVSAATAWLDERNRAGLLEPVATHPDHETQGLARAVVADALRALNAAGARSAQIGTSGRAAQSAYTADGFRPWRQESTFRKCLGESFARTAH